MLATNAVPVLGDVGAVVGVAYLMLIVQLPPAAKGVVNEQFVPVMVKNELVAAVNVSAVICTEPVVVAFRIVTTLVTGLGTAGGAGRVIVKVRVLPEVLPDSVPLVAAVKLNLPPVTPVPLRLTGVPVPVTGPVAELAATARLPVKFAPFVVPVGVNTTL